jgi:dolichol-phosphate mannosyltransferase
MDSDLSYPLEYVPKMIDALERSNADIAIASPFAKGGDSSQIPFLRKFLSYGANLLDRIVFGFGFTAPSCIFRAWNRKAAKNAKITFNRFEGVSESAIYAYKKGYKVVDVPVKYHMIKGRKSSMNIAKTIKSHLELIIKLKFGD